MSTLMTCPRHYTLRTTAGHIIKFAPDEPVSVPDSVVHEALAVNILPVDDAPSIHDTGGGAPVRVEIGGLLRDALVLRAMDNLVRTNDSDDFDAGGRPKVAPVNDATGLSLSANERNAFWDKYRQIKSDGEELPTHKSLDMVIEVQGLSTPSAVAEYAEALDVPEDAIKGRSLHDQKQVLLAAAIKV